jgi:catechol 2,3-dioxygenase-like lactoylglutathione lyase family enzyme
MTLEPRPEIGRIRVSSRLAVVGVPVPLIRSSRSAVSAAPAGTDPANSHRCGSDRRYPRPMLLDGLNHVAVITADTDRLHAFYSEVFGATVAADDPQEKLRFSVVHVGPHSELNVFELYGDAPPQPQTPMFGRGRLDHIGLQAASLEAFEEIRRRLLARGCCDEFVTDFGPVLSLFFTDPDGLEAEVCVPNPDAQPGVFNPPGTPATRYVQV